MGLHTCRGFAGHFYTTPAPTLPNAFTGGIIDPFFGDCVEQTPQYDLNQARQDMLRNSTYDNLRQIEHGTYIANNTNRDIVRHHHENPRDSATSQVGRLQRYVPHLNPQHHWDSTIYPDPNSGNSNVPYYERLNRGTPMDNTTQHARRGSTLPSVVSTAPIDTMPELSDEDFQTWNEGICQDLGDYQVDLTRTAGQFDEPISPLQRQGVHSQGTAQLAGNDLGGDMDQGENYDRKVPQPENTNNKLKCSPTQVEGQPENYGSSGPNATGYKPRILSEAGYMAKVAARFRSSAQSDYPHHNQAAQLEIIRSLFEAFRNTDGIIDKPQVGQSFRDGSIPDEEIEMVCWELMLAARASQMHPLVARYHDCKHAKCTSFSQRIELTISVCKEAKSICRMLLAPNFVHRVVDHPFAELQRKRCNIRLNEKKTGQNKAGQKAIKEHYARENGEWLKDEEAGEGEEQVEDEERPRKRVRRSLRS